MATIKSVNIDRILWCMDDRGIRPSELASETKISEDRIGEILKGEAEPSVGQLKAIAKFFNRGLLFFITDGKVNEKKLRTAGFRTLANEHPHLDPTIKSLMERVERQRQIFLNLREELGDDEQPKFTPPPLPKDNPKLAAAAIRSWLSLNGERSFSGYRRAIESMGVLVFRSNGYVGAWQVPNESEIAGFSIYHKEFPIVFVRKQEPQQRQLFTLAHELGHLVLHGTGSIDEEANLYAYKGKEWSVNAFAGYLLVPDAALNQISDQDKPSSADRFEVWLRQPALQWGVSVEVILIRLLNSNRLKREEYDSYKEWKKLQHPHEGAGGSRKYRYREPLHVFGRPFVGAVLEALGSKQITATKASRFLDNIKITDVHRLEREFNAL